MIIEELNPANIEHLDAPSFKANKWMRPAFIRVKTKLSELEDYELGQTIGEGGFGFVRKAIHLPTRQTVAVKICPVSSYDRDQLRTLEQQIDIQRHILHENIAQIYEVIKTNSKIYIFMEYCKNGELFDRINRNGPLTEKDAAKVFHQILSALIYLRQNNISHRDIKPENILFDQNWNVKIIDFGFSCISQEGKMRKTICGTPSYMPPEIIKRTPYDSELADVWSLGVTLYAMLSANLPFQSENPQKRKQNIISLKYTLQPCLSPKAQKLFNSIFVEAKYRPKLQDLLRSQFALSYEAPIAKSVDFKSQNIELESEVIDALGASGCDVIALIQSVRDCKLNKYRTLYFLTLKKHKKLTGKQQLSSFKKQKKLSAVKLAPIASRTPSISKKSSSLAVQEILSIKKTLLIKPQNSKLKNSFPTHMMGTLTPTMSPITPSMSRLRKNQEDSPRRLIDCLSAYKCK